MLLTALSFSINYPSFQAFLVANVPNADGFCTTETGFMVVEKNPFTQADIDAVNGYYNSLTQAGEAAKSQPTQQQLVQNSIQAAINFGAQIMLEFSADNVIKGITQAGQTINVANYLVNLLNYISSGSLFAAITEINNLIADTSAAKTALSPFVTNEVLYAYLNKIQTYLGIPLTANPGS